MKNIFLIVISFFALFSCCEKNAKKSEQFSIKENVAIDFSTEQNFLLLPCEDRGEELQATIWVDDKKINTYVIRIAQNSVDYWIPVDLSAWKNKKVSLKLNKAAAFLKEAKLADTFECDDNEPFRPVYHFTPPYGWMNDPNGMVYYAGEWHLFYQFNPFGTRWQNMSWGHAVSADLTHWQHLSVALYPDSLGTIFSGSAVVDETNSAGFQTGNEKTLLAFYTQNRHDGQWQSLAYSNDKGRTWTKYEKNPVLKKANAPDFRDPKVFWYAPASRWIMVLAVGNHAEFYSSANAKEWTFESEFGANYGSHDGVWECPDLLQFGEKWALLISNDRVANVRHSATQYFVGSFDGHAFTCDFSPTEQHWLDYGKDHYATVSWANAPADRKIVLPWMSNWQYANDVPTKYFRSAMALPRYLTLAQENGKYLVKSYPVEEIQARRGKAGNIPDFNTNRIFDVPTNGAFEILLEIEAQSAQQFGFNLKNSKDESVEFAFDLQKNEFSIDRIKSGITNFNSTFATKSVAPVLAKPTHILRIFVDKSSIEAFLNGGEAAITHLVFPNEPYSQIEFFTKDNQFKINDLKIFEIN
jgi:fructan beta-fructosidase